MVINTRLFHYTVGNVADTDFTIHRDIVAVYWTMPNIMIAPAVPHEVAAIFPQNLPDLFLVFGHTYLLLYFK
jgi:hypothetical protein